VLEGEGVSQPPAALASGREREAAQAELVGGRRYRGNLARMRLDAYTIVFLRRPPDSPQFTEEQLDELQRGHLAFNARMRAAGHALIAGPFMDQADVSWRGISVFRTSIEETRRLVAEDPSIQARRMSADIFTWLMPEGTLGDRPATTIDVD